MLQSGGGLGSGSGSYDDNNTTGGGGQVCMLEGRALLTSTVTLFQSVFPLKDTHLCFRAAAASAPDLAAMMTTTPPPAVARCAC